MRKKTDFKAMIRYAWRKDESGGEDLGGVKNDPGSGKSGKNYERQNQEEGIV